MKFQSFPKIARLAREVVVTEKIDGTNAQVSIRAKEGPDGAPEMFDVGYDIQVEHEGLTYYLRAGSRTRWLPHGHRQGDNFGFAAWVHEHAHELVKLGPGRHFGEWHGKGIQRGYGLDHKRFALFNVGRWRTDYDYEWVSGGIDRRNAPSCCHVVPVLYRGPFNTEVIRGHLAHLKTFGSSVSPGFMKPEGIIVYHTHANTLFKMTLDGDDHKGDA